MLLEVKVETQSLLVFFANVVRRRCNDQLERFSRDRPEEIKTVAGVDYDVFRRVLEPTDEWTSKDGAVSGPS